MMIRIRLMLLVVFTWCVLQSLCGCRADHDTVLSGGKQADQAFLTGYDAARHRALDSIPLAIVAVEGDLIVVRRGVIGERYPVIDPVYTALKDVSHVVLGVWLSVWDAGPESAMRHSAAWSGPIDSIERGLSRSCIPPDQQPRQERLLSESRELILLASGGHGVSPEQLADWSRAIKPDLMMNVQEAARSQLLSVNESVKTIAGTMSTSERESFVVVVCGVHQARKGNIEMQYFTRLLGPEGVEHQRRLLFAESVYDLKGALKLLGAHQLDRSISESFFGIPDRMQQDLLEDAASRILPELGMPSDLGVHPGP
ncbi:MAG: hypothetical protein P8K80_06205 [Phycisphaerales bacterium]|nr:hypothetical protein [Phycisphaerales bacterium]